MPANPRFRFPRLAAVLALAFVPLACSEDEGEGDDVMCGDAKCDDLGPVGEQLAMFNDPIAVWLRANIDKNGQIDHRSEGWNKTTHVDSRISKLL